MVTKGMKVLLATPLYPPDSGGPATYAKLLVEQYDEIILVKFGDVRHLSSGIRHIAYFWRVLQAGKRADIIFALDPVSTGLPALIAARILGKPFVVKIVGDYAWEQGTQRYGIQATLDEFVKQERTPFAVACLRVVETFVARSATKIIVPSTYLKGIILAWSKKISPDRISVIYNSIELPPLAHPTDAKASASKILSVGRLVPWKGMDRLVDAVEEVRKELPSVTLQIVGDGPDKHMLMEKGEKQLGDAITFTGALSHAEVLVLMQSATLYVQNSSYEGLSHQLIEALKLGKAIVATDVGGNPELIQDTVNGLLIPFGTEDENREALVSSLKRLLEDDALRARLGACAKESSQKFEVSIMIRQTRELFESILSHP